MKNKYEKRSRALKCLSCYEQINSKVSKTAPDLIVDQKPQPAQHSSKGSLGLVLTGTATLAVGAFLVHRFWPST